MESLWTETLRLYIRHTISPDGRDTFESTPQLAKALQRVASRPSGDTLLDLGCGWGASLKPFANHFAHIIGVDCNAENLRTARQKYQEMPHISFMQGNLLQLPLPPGSVDLLVSSLMLHQVSDADQLALFQKIHSWLKDDGEMVFADELILFDPEAEPERFNRVYRYLLANTTPKDVYEQQIKPYLADGYVYTWQDMKANTPPEFWFHVLPHLQTKLHAANLVLREVKELTLFFGLFRVTKQA